MLDHIREALIQWFEGSKRDFFWRKHNDPYIILITEILLKKTTANVVARFLPHFLQRYPNIHALYDSDISDIQSLLVPIGLSEQRATQLKNLAQTLTESYSEKVPSNKEELLKLPGVGNYTAGAVLSFAYGLPEPIVDTNVARLIMRIFSIEPSHYEARRSPEIWSKARELIGQDRNICKYVNWALLDLAALVCKPRKPLHEKCPIKDWCILYEEIANNLG